MNREFEELERLLIIGLESGPSVEVTPEYWEKQRRELITRHTSRLRGREPDERCQPRSNAEPGSTPDTA
jgi:hypothetical protein